VNLGHIRRTVVRTRQGRRGVNHRPRAAQSLPPIRSQTRLRGQAHGEMVCAKSR
jgi:hypothetical protein